MYCAAHVPQRRVNTLVLLEFHRFSQVLLWITNMTHFVVVSHMFLMYVVLNT